VSFAMDGTLLLASLSIAKSPLESQVFLIQVYNSKVRNIIEIAFGILKARWKILRERSFYSIKTQEKIITVCYLLHNHIRRVMVVDPIDEIEDQNILGVDGEMIHHLETSDAWSR
ncbi:hypothetical protein HN51_001637, partial [Arachis hypogaea]